MKQLELKVIPREETGRGSNRRLRASGKIPAVIYGKKGSQPLIIEQTDFRVLWKAISGVTTLIQVDVEGDKPALTIIKEVQRDARPIGFDLATRVVVRVDGQLLTRIEPAAHPFGKLVRVGPDRPDCQDIRCPPGLVNSPRSRFAASPAAFSSARAPSRRLHLVAACEDAPTSALQRTLRRNGRSFDA